MTHPYTLILQIHLAFTKAARLKARNERDQGGRSRNWRFQFTLLYITQGLPDPWNFLLSQLVNSIDHMVFPVRDTVSMLGKHQNKVHRKFFESISRNTEPQPLPYKCFTMPSCFHTFVHLFNIYWRSATVTVNAVPTLRLLIDQSIKLDETV